MQLLIGGGHFNVIRVHVPLADRSGNMNFGQRDQRYECLISFYGAIRIRVLYNVDNRTTAIRSTNPSNAFRIDRAIRMCVLIRD